jgi:hypothetical protein
MEFEVAKGTFCRWSGPKGALFKIVNRLKINNDNFKVNDDFKSDITVRKIPKEY